MATTDPRIDAYIEKAQPFARPVLEHLRKVIHKACPQVEETMKWSFPHFDYKGILCSMASFKQHCVFGFWKTAIMNDPEGLFTEKMDAMGSMGKLTSVKDLPSDKVLIAYIKEAMRLNDENIKLPTVNRGKSEPKPAIEEPDYFTKLLKANPEALKVWKAFAPSHRKEYLEWITEAKTDATRDKRMAKSIEQILEGKQRHWKYQ